MQNIFGWIIDFAAWALIYSLLYWLLGKFTSKVKQDPGTA